MGQKSKLAVFDFETGGLDCEKNPVMELAVVVAGQKDFREITTYETLIQPYSGKGGVELVYEKGALNTHGISISECTERGVSISAMVRVLCDLFKSLKPKGDKGGNKPILAGHNVPFDIAFLKYAFEICDQRLSEYVLSNNGQIVYWDTQQMATQVWNLDPESPLSFSLTNCFTRAGLGSFMAHRALPDTRSTLDLMRFLIETMRGSAGAVKQVAPDKKRVIKEMPEGLVKFQM